MQKQVWRQFDDEKLDEIDFLKKREKKNWCEIDFREIRHRRHRNSGQRQKMCIQSDEIFENSNKSNNNFLFDAITNVNATFTFN